MTKKLVWRLSKLPSADELRELVKDKIITQEEAREVLFKLEEDENRDKESLKDEIKFLRELVDKLSSKKQVIETIKTVEIPYYREKPWYQPYAIWCAASNPGYTLTSATASSGTVALCNASNSSLSDINNF